MIVTDEMVNRFLAWPLPESVCSDLIVTRSGVRNRLGTMLLTATEAEAMLRHVLATASIPTGTKPDCARCGNDITKCDNGPALAGRPACAGRFRESSPEISTSTPFCVDTGSGWIREREGFDGLWLYHKGDDRIPLRDLSNPEENFVRSAYAQGQAAATLCTPAGSRPQRYSKTDGRQLSPIERFACAVIEEHRNDGYPGDVDGGWLHEKMESLGLTHSVRMTEPCNPEGCPCMECGDFPMDCTRLTGDMIRLLSVYRAEETPRT
jgi:hypothetical protein